MTITPEQAVQKYPGATTFRFGETPDMCARILEMVRSGAKTATCALPSEFSPDAPAPSPGRVDIALDWQGKPALAIRTLSVERIRYCDMDASRVPAQGEFEDLDHWRAAYREELSTMTDFHPDIELLYERFELVEDFGASQ